jgi:hypothetical protein
MWKYQTAECETSIKPIVGKLSIALDTKDTYNKDDKSNSVFSARKKISTSKHKIIMCLIYVTQAIF